jgi:hypothetical protein
MQESRTLGAIVKNSQSLDGVQKSDLRPGDRVLVETSNSLYTIIVLDELMCWVWGGWFDRQGIAPQRIAINGCTWGGSTIKQDVVAALGLQLEFGNGVVTSPIRGVRLIRARCPDRGTRGFATGEYPEASVQ